MSSSTTPRTPTSSSSSTREAGSPGGSMGSGPNPNCPRASGSSGPRRTSPGCTSAPTSPQVALRPRTPRDVRRDGPALAGPLPEGRARDHRDPERPLPGPRGGDGTAVPGPDGPHLRERPHVLPATVGGL